MVLCFWEEVEERGRMEAQLMTGELWDGMDGERAYVEGEGVN